MRRIVFLFSRLLVVLLLVSVGGLSVPRAYASSERVAPVTASALSSRETLQEYVPGEVIVRYREASSGSMSVMSVRSPIAQIAERTGHRVSMVSKRNNIALMRVPEETNIEEYARTLAGDPDVLYAEPNYIYHTTALGINDTRASDLWGLEKIGMESAWTLSEATSSAEVIVAVIDTGVAYTHPDLATNMWNGTACVSDTGAALGNCLHGYDFADNDKDPFPIVDIPDTNEGMHGTHVAGTIAAVRNNSLGVAGVAPRAKIMALRSRLDSAEIIRAIDFARYNGAKVINASFGGGNFSQATKDAIDAFPGIFVTAAGNNNANNDTTAFYPCSYTSANIVCVAATGQTDALASFSNYGNTSVDVAAPGVGIWSGDPTRVVANETLSSVTVPNIPSSWTRTGSTTNNWRTATTSIDSAVYTHLYGDTSSPYSNSADTAVTMPTFDLASSGVFDAQLSFGLRCDTAASSTAWLDYLEVQFSIDGTNFVTPLTTIYGEDGTFATNTLSRFDATEVQSFGGTLSAGQPGYGTNLYITVPSAYRSSTSAVRFHWVTDGDDNNYAGCRLSQIKMTTFDASGSYSSLSGTSMAAPHVAGLAALTMGYVPGITATQARTALMQTVSTSSDLTGKLVTSGRVQAPQTLLRAKSLEKQLLGLSFAEAVGTTTINHASSTAQVVLPFGTSLASLTASTSASGDAVVSSLGAQNYSTSTVTYTITSLLDNSTSTYMVTAVTSPDVELSTTTSTVALSGLQATGTVTIPGTVTNATLDGGSLRVISATSTTLTFAAALTTNATLGTTPVTIAFPDGLSLTASNTSWDGVVRLAQPITSSSVSAPADSGYTATTQFALEVGVSDTELLLNKAMRLKIDGHAGKLVGWKRGSTVQKIITTCTADTQTAGDALAAGGDCIISVGGDMVLWTKHLTTFFTYTQTQNPVVSSGGGGGGGGGGFTTIYGCTNATATNYKSSATKDDGTCTYATAATTSNVPARVVGDAVQSAYQFTTDLTVGSQGIAVTELQKKLTAEGVYTGPISGTFGPLTTAGVQAYQRKYSITPASGYVGPLTRAKLNASSATSVTQAALVTTLTTPTTLTDTQRQALIATLRAQIAILMQELAKLLQERLR